MKWKDEYATGDEEVDRQHRSLFEFSEEFAMVLEKGCSPATYEGFLEFLHAYVEIHFGYEEKCMQIHDCPAAERNRAEHQFFLNVINQEISRYALDGFSLESAKTFLDRINSWIAGHILRVDVQLRGAIEKST